MAAKRDAAAKVDLKEDIASDWKERRDAAAKVDLKEDIASDWKEKRDAAVKLDLKEDVASDWKSGWTDAKFCMNRSWTGADEFVWDLECGRGGSHT
jgi:hypothetical protein